MNSALQIVFNSLVSGFLLSLVSLGFSFIFRVLKVFHFAHAGVYASGALSCWWVLAKTDNWIAASAFAILVVTLLSWVMEKTVYLPLNKKQSSQSISLIASMGFYIVFVNVLAMLFENDSKLFKNSPSGTIEFGEIIFTKVQLIQSIVSVAVIALFLFFLKYSKSKLALQAISDNETISKVFGINTGSERIKIFIAGSVLACVAAILTTMETGIDPHKGMSITLNAAVVAILVSRLNVLLVVALAIVLTLLQNTIEMLLNAQWKDGITFLILLLVILFKTEGIISYNLRKDKT